jgi:tetratricopeptide (TPR) repeat protein
MPTASTNASRQPASETEFFRECGSDCLREGNYNEAVVIYDQALSRARMASPATAFSTATTTSDDEPELLLCLSLALANSTPPRLDLALQTAEAVIEQWPRIAQAYVSIAEIHERQESWDAAEAALLMAVDMTSGMSRVRAQQLLAGLRRRLGRGSLNAGGGTCNMQRVPISREPPAYEADGAATMARMSELA